MIEFNPSMIGKKVRFTNESLHKQCPRWFPVCGTIGTIMPPLKSSIYMQFSVQWPYGSTSHNDRWCCPSYSLELVEDGTTSTFVVFAEYDNGEFVTKHRFVCLANSEKEARLIVERNIRKNNGRYVRILDVSTMNRGEVFVGW